MREATWFYPVPGRLQRKMREFLREGTCDPFTCPEGPPERTDYRLESGKNYE